MGKLKLLSIKSILLISTLAISFGSKAHDPTGQHYQIFGPRQVSCDLNAFYWTDVVYEDADGILYYSWTVKNGAGNTIQTANTPYLYITFPNIYDHYSVILYVNYITFDESGAFGGFNVFNQTISVTNDIGATLSQATNYMYGHYYGQYLFESNSLNTYWQTAPAYSPMLASQSIYIGGSSAPATSTDIQPDYGGAFIHSPAHVSAHAPAIYMVPGFIVESGATFRANTIIDCATLSSPGQQRQVSNQNITEEFQPTVSLIDNTKLKKAYPNPTKGVITIPVANAPQKSSSILIYNSLGELIYTKTIPAGDFSLSNVTTDLSTYAAGIYTIKIISNDTTSVQQAVLEK